MEGFSKLTDLSRRIFIITNLFSIQLRKTMNKTTYLKRVNFKDHKLGLYDLQTFSKDWNNPKWNRGITEKRCRIVKVNGENVLEITIPKNTVSNGGSFWRLELSPSLKDVTLEYDIMFGNNFNFVRGGKLPGLGGGSCPGGGSKDKEGFSARLMWRVDNFHSLNLIKNRHKAYLVQYVYYPERHESKNWGEDIIYRNEVGRIFVRSKKWYTLSMNIKLAKDSRKKDTLLAWVNGNKVSHKKLNLRKNNNYAVDQLMFSLFFGGHESSWATKKKEKIYFRNFVITGK